MTEAYYMSGPIKAVTKEGNIVKLRDIIRMQGEYYGITLRGNLLFPLTSVETTYFIKDIKKSRIRTFMFYAGLYTACVILGVLFIYELIDILDQSINSI